MSEVFLTDVTRADGPDVIAAHLDSRDHHLPWVTTFTDLAGFDAWFARLDPARTVSLIARHRDGGIVGLCTLSEIVRGGFQSAYLGFHGMRVFASKGLMTQAVRLTVQHAFTTLELHRVEANIQPGNTKSIALAQRVGFTKEGYSRDYLKIGGAWRDHERWAILATDLRAAD